MKYIAGDTLASSLTALRKSIESGEEGLAEERRKLVTLLQKAAQGVAYAHQHGVLHRDLKPANILVDESGEPHVADFGLAKRIDHDQSITQTGAVLGTPAYMAPEQASGSKGSATMAADVYSLGAILYEIMTGRRPFEAENVYELLKRVREDEPTPPRDLDPKADSGLEAVCLKALSRIPSDRYASADEFAADLKSWLGGTQTVARPRSAMYQLKFWLRQHVRGLAVSGILGFLVGAALAFASLDALRPYDDLVDLGLEYLSAMDLPLPRHAKLGFHWVPDWMTSSICALGAVLFAFSGLLLAYSSRPRDVLADIGVGLTTALISAVAFFALAYGPWFVPANLDELAALARPSQTSESTRVNAHLESFAQHELDNADKYARLLNEGSDIRLSGLGALLLPAVAFTVVFVCQSVVAGVILRRSHTNSSLLLAYAELALTLQLALLTTVLASSTYLSEMLWALTSWAAGGSEYDSRHIEAWTIVSCIVLSFIAFLAHLREWSLLTRMIAYTCCFLLFGLLSKDFQRFDHQYTVTAIIVSLLFLALLLARLGPNTRADWITWKRLCRIALGLLVAVSIGVAIRNRPSDPEALILSFGDEGLSPDARRRAMWKLKHYDSCAVNGSDLVFYWLWQVEPPPLREEQRRRALNLAITASRNDDEWLAFEAFDLIDALVSRGRIVDLDVDYASLADDYIKLVRRADIDHLLYLGDRPSKYVEHGWTTLLPGYIEVIQTDPTRVFHALTVLAQIKQRSSEQSRIIIDYLLSNHPVTGGRTFVSSINQFEFALILTGATNDENPDAKASAIALLGQLSPRSTGDELELPKSALDNIQKLFNDKDPYSRMAAMRALLWVHGNGTCSAPPAVRAAISDADEDVRYYALRILENFDTADEEIVRLVGNSLRDPSDKVRLAACQHLLHMGPDARSAVPAILALLKDRTVKVRLAARSALRRIDSRAAERAGL